MQNYFYCQGMHKQKEELSRNIRRYCLEFSQNNKQEEGGGISKNGKKLRGGGKKYWHFDTSQSSWCSQELLFLLIFFNYTLVFYIFFCICMSVYNLNQRKGGRRKEMKPSVSYNIPVASRNLAWNWPSMPLKLTVPGGQLISQSHNCGRGVHSSRSKVGCFSSDSHSGKFTLNTFPFPVSSKDL